MRTSLLALGFLAIGLAQCGNRDLFVADERGENAGEAGALGETGGTGAGTTGGSGGGSTGGNENGGTENTGGSPERGGTGSGAEGGEPSGTGGSDSGGTNTGGTDAGGSGGSGTAARGGMNDGGRAGSASAGAGSGGMNDGGRAGDGNAGRAGASGSGGASTNDCEALGREYRERLAAAQQCSPQLTVEQCTIEMPDDFFCPCKTWVNPMRDADIRRLNEILEKRTNCARICPAIACPDVRRGVCSVNTMTDTAPIIGPAPGRCTAAP